MDTEPRRLVNADVPFARASNSSKLRCHSTYRRRCTSCSPFSKATERTTPVFAHREGTREKLLLLHEALMAQLLDLRALRCFQVLERVAGLSQVTMRDSKKIKQFVAAIKWIVFLLTAPFLLLM